MNAIFTEFGNEILLSNSVEEYFISSSFSLIVTQSKLNDVADYLILISL